MSASVCSSLILFVCLLFIFGGLNLQFCLKCLWCDCCTGCLVCSFQYFTVKRLMHDCCYDQLRYPGFQTILWRCFWCWVSLCISVLINRSPKITCLWRMHIITESHRLLSFLFYVHEPVDNDHPTLKTTHCGVSGWLVFHLECTPKWSLQMEIFAHFVCFQADISKCSEHFQFCCKESAGVSLSPPWSWGAAVWLTGC